LLEPEELRYLTDILDFWIDGYEEATTNTIVDMPARSPEELLETVTGLHDKYHRAIIIREKLQAMLKGEEWQPLTLT
jgi:hypothetical protein